MRYAAIFCDLGGVALTNGWDRKERAAAAQQFGMEPNELERRHAAAADDFECGRLPLGRYLESVFLTAPDSAKAESIRAFMQAQSRPYPAALEALARIGRRNPGLLLATLNNEAAELNQYRIETFRLRDYFRLFFSSCYLGARKPDPRAYQLVLAYTQLPAPACLMLDDREENLAAAGRLGMATWHITVPGDLSRVEQMLNQASAPAGARL